MRKHYDFSDARPNPYARQLKKQVTNRLDEDTLSYFDGEVELRQVFEAADFAPSDPTGELMKKEDELRRAVESRER